MIRNPTVGDALRDLARGPRHRLGDLLQVPVPKTPGLYALWHADGLLYIGIAYRDPAETSNPRAAGVQGRLRTYLDAWLTSDFVLAVTLRFIVSQFDATRLEALATGRLRMDDIRRIVKPWLAEHIEFSTASTDGRTARVAETEARRMVCPAWARQR